MKKTLAAQSILLALLLALVGANQPGLTGLPPAGRTCTSFCLNNGGRAVFGTNFDNEIWEGLLFVSKRGVTKTGWEPSTDGTYARWTSRYGSVTFNLAGNQMVWAGMNEAGLSLSTMWLGETEDPPPDERPPLVSPLWLQLQLDTCATIQEVMANDEWVRINGVVDHYLVCDRTAACAVVEFLEEGTIFHTAGDLTLPVLTNNLYQESVRAWQSGRLESNALERFGIAADRVTGFEPMDASSAVAYAFATLDQARIPPHGGSPTQWSIVFDAENLRVHWTTSRNLQVRSLDLARLDLSCEAPVTMLDVHAPLTGDVSAGLEPFSFGANLRHTQNFMDKWGGDFSPLEIEVLERGLASFPCRASAAPAQTVIKPLIPPLARWVALAAVHRLWPVGLALAAGLVALVVWRLRRRG